MRPKSASFRYRDIQRESAIVESHCQFMFVFITRLHFMQYYHTQYVRSNMKLLLLLYLLDNLLSEVSGFSAALPFCAKCRTILSSKFKNNGDDVEKKQIIEELKPTIVSSASTGNEDDVEKETVEELKTTFSTVRNGVEKEEWNIVDRDPLPVHQSVQTAAGLLCDDHERCAFDETTNVLPHRGRSRKRVLILCTGGTLTMSNDPTQGNSLAPVQGALTSYLANMRELTEDPEMPEIISHEYTPLIDSSDMGPGDWALIANDIATNYYHFDGTKTFLNMKQEVSVPRLTPLHFFYWYTTLTGFVVLMGTDTMAYAASALTFMYG